MDAIALALSLKANSATAGQVKTAVINSMLRRRMLFSSQNVLPAEYQRVEYIEGTGTQYIDSGIECTSDLAVEFEFSVSTTVNMALAGGINTTSPLFRHHASPYADYMYSLAIATDGIPSVASPNIDTVYNIYVDPVAGTYKFTGDNYNESGTFTPLTARTTGRNYGIMARISQTGAIQSRPNRIYYFKFYRDGQLIGDFIPCYRKSDNAAGMYDFVTKTFFANAGTGTIGVGPDA